MGTLEAPSSFFLLSLVKFPSISWKPGKRPSPGPRIPVKIEGVERLLLSFGVIFAPVLDPWIDCGLHLDYFDGPFE